MENARRLLVASVALLALASLPTRAEAVPFTFDCVSENQGDCGTLEDQLLVDVTSVGGGTQVQFTFSNNVGDASSITDIYFDTISETNPFTGIASITGTAGVDFSEGASPGDLPGGGGFEAVFSADSNPPTAPNGINAANESLAITFNLNQAINATFLSVLSQMAGGDLLIGLHVQAINSPAGSASFVNNPPNGNPPGGDDPGGNPIPEPATMLLLGSGLAATAYKARRRRNSTV